MSPSEVLKQLLEARKTAEVAEILDAIEAAGKFQWRPLDDRENNLPTVNLSASPQRAVVERITNAIDALLEMRAHKESDPRRFQSPRSAAEEWFQIPSAGLSALEIKDRRRLADGVVVTLVDGDSDRKPSVEIRDSGVGLAAAEFPKTICSLNRTNKMDKFYLCGAHGQGGSGTFPSCSSTIIISRKQESSCVAFTVVRFNELDPTMYKQGRFEYLVGMNNEVLDVESREIGLFEFPTGTIVRHVAYDMEGCTATLGPGQSSIYGMVQSVLFDPVLPFWVEDRRKGRTIRRTVIGSRNRLISRGKGEEEDERWPHVRYHQPQCHYKLVTYGFLEIEYWIVEPAKRDKEEKSESKVGKPNSAYVDSRHPVVLTLNGQVHGDLPASVVKKDAEMPFVASRVIVHVKCDGMTPEGKRLLFPSTREQARKGAVLKEIHNALVELLKSDEELQDIEAELREAGTKEMDEQTELQIKQQVAKLLQNWEGMEAFPGAPVIDIEKIDPVRRGRRGPRKPLAPLPTQEPPTYVKIVGEPPIRLKQGMSQIVRIYTDAPDSYYSDDLKARRIHLYVNPPFSLKGSSPLKGGRIRFWVNVPTEASVGTKTKLSAEVQPTSAPTLRHDTEGIVVEPPKGKTEKAVLKLPPHKIEWIEPESEKWGEFGWTEEDASAVAESGGITWIYLSTAYQPYASRYDAMIKKDDATAQSFRTRYSAYMAAYSLVQRMRGKQLRDALPPEMSDRFEEFENQERSRAAWLIAHVAMKEVMTKESVTEE